MRDGEVQKVPYMCVIGRREADENTVALRSRGAGKKQDIMSSDAFIARVLQEIAERTLAIPDDVVAAATDAAAQPVATT